MLKKWCCEDHGFYNGPCEMRKTAKDKALALLRKHEMVSSAMLVNAGVGYRYGHVLSVLRKRGHVIKPIKPKDGPCPDQKNTWWYELEEDAECTCMCDGPIFCDVHREQGIDAAADAGDAARDEVRHHGPRRMP